MFFVLDLDAYNMYITITKYYKTVSDSIYIPSL